MNRIRIGTLVISQENLLFSFHFHRIGHIIFSSLSTPAALSSITFNGMLPCVVRKEDQFLSNGFCIMFMLCRHQIRKSFGELLSMIKSSGIPFFQSAASFPGNETHYSFVVQKCWKTKQCSSNYVTNGWNKSSHYSGSTKLTTTGPFYCCVSWWFSKFNIKNMYS